MHQYFIKTPWLVKKLFSQYVWELPNDNNEVYLTFDDGPHPEITPWVLEQLRLYDAKATFFCIGKNVMQFPAIYQQIVKEGHAIGNHTQDHLNGWKVTTSDYIQNIEKAAHYINTNLFRPPYGRMKRKHVPYLKKAMNANTKVIMWDVLSADFDTTISKEQCVTNVVKNVKAGSIIVFHDSEKACKNLYYTLPLLLQVLQSKNFVCKCICL